MMGMQKKNSNTPRTGFSAIELVITVTVLGIVTGFGIVGISRARASVRLSGAAREFASYIEKARLFSIRSHADDATERATITINGDKASYNVTLDLDGDGDLDTTTIALPDGVTFDSVETIAFDWRGRTWNTVSGITSSNAQVSFRLQYGSDIASIDITGSGDVTVNSLVFDDSVPNVNLRVSDLTSGTTPSTTTPVTTTPTTPDGTLNPTTSIPTDPTTTTPTGPTTTNPTTPTTPTNPTTPTTPTNPTTPTTPTNPTTPTTPANPTTVPAVCTITTNPTSLSLGLDGTTTIKVSHDATTSLSIGAASSKASDLQVTGKQTVASGGTATFTVKSKKTIGIYSLTFSSSCGSKTVTVVIAGIKLL
jgi:Tfp pilus assembly protein FimT